MCNMQMLLHIDKNRNNTIETEKENPNSRVMKRCGSSQVVGEMQMVILYPSGWQKSKNHLLMAK